MCAFRILVVDDDQSCLEIMTCSLERKGHEVFAVTGGVSALEYLKDHYEQTDLVLLDLMMPDMYGLDVIQVIRNNPQLKHIPVLLQTGTSQISNISKALEFNDVTYILKPYKTTDLIASVEKSLASKLVMAGEKSDGA
jgi:two-component system sensor histidine kinase ChiS